MMSTDDPPPTLFLSYAHDDRVKAKRSPRRWTGGYTIWWTG